MRKTALNAVHELARRDERVVFLGSDLGPGTLDAMKAEMPDRFFMEGVAEANLVGMAAGLALEGFIPYVNTIATFLTRRCFDQLVIDACLHGAPIRLIANGGGLVYAPLGPTHQAIEDLAILRAVPGMTVIAPADADEMARLMPLTLDHPGPIYIRLGKGHDPIVSDPSIPFAIGRGLTLRRGDAALLLTTGVTLKLALEAADRLSARGLDCEVLHLPTVKPLDVDAVLQAARRTPVAVTVEEHSVIGGLGGAVAEALAESGAGCRLRRLGIPDVFAERYGSQADLMRHFGITADAVVEAVVEASEAVEAP
ncbi:MAG: transketolase C-terminal domain-containing protein [Acidobacteriota bacterium]